MRRFHSILILALASAGVAAPAAEPALPAKEKFLIVVLAGQSNMAGRGKTEAEDTTPHERVLMLDAKNTWVPAREPLHFDKPNIAGVGPGFAFARKMAEQFPEATIGVVPCAMGGSPIARWQPDGDLYKGALARAKVAVAKGTLTAILWHQGETDAASHSSEKYLALLRTTIQSFRKELGNVPFIAGTLADFNPRRESVNNALAELPKNEALTAVASSAGLKDKGDKIHFDAAGARELGKRYFEALVPLLKK